jgi:hypothetical protein
VSPISIFDGVVKDENNYSRLLCNLLNRSPHFRAVFLDFIGEPTAIHSDFTACDQRNEEGGGRPDLELTFGDISKRFIEVKANRACPITYHQARAYGNAGWLTFLVPAGWRFCGCKPPESGLKFWNELSTAIWRDAELNQDTLFREFQMLINRKFPSAHLETKEVEALARCDLKALAPLIVIVPRVVDALLEHFDGQSVGGRKLSVKSDCSDDQYGFLVKSESGDLMWVGTWRSAGLLLGIAYDTRWPLKATPPGFWEDGSTDGWRVFSLEGVVLSGESDIVSAAIRQIESRLEPIVAAQFS